MSGYETRFRDKRSLSICLVDDDVGILHSITRTLAMGGYSNVQSWTNWPLAVQGLERVPAELIMLDVLMPEVSGLEALSDALLRWPLTSVVMVTGVNEVRNAVECMKLGASDYLVKPLSSELLLACVNKQVLGRNILSKKIVKGTAKRTTEQIDDLVSRVQGFLPEQLILPNKENMGNKQIQELAESLVRYIRSKEVFSDPELTLRKAALALETNTSYLSRSVNIYWGINFRTFLNSIRLAVFLKIVREGGLLDFTIEGLAASVGFSRSATFFSVFKNYLGITPGKLIKTSLIGKKY